MLRPGPVLLKAISMVTEKSTLLSTSTSVRRARAPALKRSTVGVAVALSLGRGKETSEKKEYVAKTLSHLLAHPANLRAPCGSEWNCSEQLICCLPIVAQVCLSNNKTFQPVFRSIEVCLIGIGWMEGKHDRVPRGYAHDVTSLACFFPTLEIILISVVWGTLSSRYGSHSQFNCVRLCQEKMCRSEGLRVVRRACF